MKNRSIFLFLLWVLTVGKTPAQSEVKERPVKASQASAPASIPFGREAFEESNHTSIRWLGNAGFFVNSRGTTFMIDPVLTGFDLPLLITPPITPSNIPQLDAILITHADNDHYSSTTCKEYHSTHYVASLMKEIGIDATGHSIGDILQFGNINATLLYADHAWQNSTGHERTFSNNDCCGFWIETPDGTIWAPGDTRFYPELLHNKKRVDVLLFDFSDDSWHMGFDNAIAFANAYPHAELLLSHWGSVNAPTMKPFNANPADLEGKIINPERIRLLAPGKEFRLTHQDKKIDTQIVRLSKITVDPNQLKAYNAFLKEEIEASMRLEPGVKLLYAMAEKDYPNKITILEIYADRAAYEKHIKTAHFLKYKQGTLKMVSHLELIDCNALIPKLKMK